MLSRTVLFTDHLPLSQENFKKHLDSLKHDLKDVLSTPCIGKMQKVADLINLPAKPSSTSCVETSSSDNRLNVANS